MRSSQLGLRRIRITLGDEPQAYGPTTKEPERIQSSDLSADLDGQFRGHGARPVCLPFREDAVLDSWGVDVDS